MGNVSTVNQKNWGIIPIVAVRSNKKYGKYYHRYMLPLIPCEAGTVHSNQGITKRKVLWQNYQKGLLAFGLVEVT